MYKDLFYFDIETTTKYKDIVELEKLDPRGYSLFIKKCQSMKEFDISWNEPPKFLYSAKASLFPEYGKIICMSFGVFKDEKIEIRTLIDENEEKLMQRIQNVFYKLMSTNKRLCGFKIKAFDIPWLNRKMYKYGIDIPRSINFSGLKPWEIVVTDLYEIWKGTSNNGTSLDEMTYELGIESPKKLMSGSDVYHYYWDHKDTESIINYCEADIMSMIESAKKLKV